MLKIKASEADAEAKRLAGVGMANMRAAMAQGFQDAAAAGPVERWGKAFLGFEIGGWWLEDGWKMVR